MKSSSQTKEIATMIGTALRDKKVGQLLTNNLLEARLNDFFRPIVREAIAAALNLEPDDLGPELVEEGLQCSITAAYLATTWLKGEKIPKTIAYLQEKYGEQYEGFESDNVAQVALNLLITRDEGATLANAVRDGLLTQKE